MNKKGFNIDKKLLSVITATIFVAVFFLGLEVANKNKIAYGLDIANVSIGGLTPSQALQKLIQHNETYLDKQVILIANGQEIITSPRDLGITIDPVAEIDKISTIGRDTNIIVGLAEQTAAFFNLMDSYFTPGINEKVFDNSTKTLFASIEKWPSDAAIIYNALEGKYSFSKEEDGYIVPRAELKDSILLLAQETKNEPVILNTEFAAADIKIQTAEKTGQEANLLLSQASYELVFEEKSWPIDKETLIDWLIFEKKSQDNINTLVINLDKEKIEGYLLNTIAHQIDIPRQNAELTLKDGKVTLFKPSQNGRELDAKESSSKIADQILSTPNVPQNNENTENESTKTQIQLVIKERPAEITTESINDLGIRELLATGESDFKGSPKNRVHNIKVGAARFNGILIKPGEEFSFNKTLGPVDATTGYKPELVIKQNQTVPEYGGGLCQVATTTFRAAVFSGLEITKRYPHAYPVKYYGTPGFDATIYPPNPDLKFMNDTPGHILIQTRIVGTKLFFDFYGTSDGRTTEVIGPIVTKKGADGSAEAYLTQKVTRNDEIIIDKTFFSKYRSPLLYPVATRNPLE
ncbi:MAG: hypothetical protein A3A97_03885 [Candidatus Terrybacteria bacterium RIFCSPLOWO2_01_FULL_40_23]|uniref:YoaR-like putative peptidoglycan binding domain-containing protein n=1 Tax=Candidatus Terrybacteria bacterium RIFCSPLOWO2_01_FULL_40_23 TaxID=1802366 RepID=A0A1G2PW25_9BACT|nr:MAG: hypothetical protein A3A97_03885 [Candidatus Terrybacteria bacterium RIFCSPLOWO2_01_FULL_40_23]